MRLPNILLFILIPFITFSQVDLNNGLVAYYPFNGNANDASGNGNNAIFNNATLTLDYYGKPNSAYHFNGVDNYIEIPNSNSLNTGNAISICAWVKPTGFYTGPCYNNMMVAKQTADYETGDYSLRFSDVKNGCTDSASIANEHFYGTDGGSNLSDPPIQLNQWYNVVFTSDGVRAKLYINCKLVVDQPASLTSFGNAYNLFLGHMDNSDYPYWLNGDLDEVRIYNRAINANEVQAYSFSCGVTQNLVTAGFTSADTVCKNTPIKFLNTSKNASNYYWNFCAADFNTTPIGSNLGNPGGDLSAPVFMDYILDDNGNYYGFVSNYNYGHLIRLNYGNSLLNTPTAEDLGNLNVIPPYAEGIQVKKFNGKCYAFIVSGGDEYGNSSVLIRVDFGNSFGNTPTANNFGNIGGLNFPHDLFITEDDDNFYGFTVNINDNTITRFDFGGALSNTPSGTNLGNIGDLNYPCGFSFINTNGTWYAFITNRNSNTVSRLSFGAYLINDPSGINIGNPGNFLNRPRDISIFESCSSIVGLIVNEEDEQTGSITKLNFSSNITSTPSATDLGNIGNITFPHSISKFFLQGNDIYSFIPNVSTSTLTRIRYVGCNSASIPSSTLQTPPSVTYSTPGIYNINLLVDIGLPTETSYCKQIVVKDCTPPVIASFNAPDTVCKNTKVNISNTSSGATNYTWSFCNNFNSSPSAINIPNPNDQLNTPVFIDYGLDSNGNYYGIATNHIPGKITRLNFGKSLLNTPTAEDLGNFNDTLPTQLEGVQVRKVNGRWYAIAVGGGNQLNNSSPRIMKLDFGNSLSNTPTVTNWGNIGKLDLPIDFSILEEDGYYYGFAMNVLSNTITRFDFGTDFTNAPKGTNLGNIGNLDYPDGFTFIKNNNKWFAFVVNTYTNNITRLSFGSSLLNKPTATEIQNPGNLLDEPRDITLFFTCNEIYGYVLNANRNDIVKLDFGSDITSIPTAVSLGNIGSFSFPHSFSSFFSSGSDVYAFVPNVNSNSISRLKFAGCKTIPGSNKQKPDSIRYDSAGTYTISLLVDIGLPTQTSFCKQIIVKDCNNPCDSFNVDAGKDVSICYGTSTQLIAIGAKTYNWNASTSLSDTTIANPFAKPSVTTQFIVTGYDSTKLCSDKDTVKVSVLPLPVFTLNNDTSICNGSNLQLNAISQNTYHYHWYPSLYLSDTSIANPTSNPADTIEYFVTAIDSNNCKATDSVLINVVPKPVVSTISDTSICFGTSTILLTTATNATSFTWNPSSGLNNSSTQSPQATPVSSATYIVTASNALCFAQDSVRLTVLSLPNVFAGNDTIICTEGIAHLHASGALTYFWYPDINLSDTSTANPFAFPASTTTYYVKGEDKNDCINIDSVIVSKQEDPVFSISTSDSLICSGKIVSLTAAGGDFYQWSPSQTLSDSITAKTTAHPSTTTKYFVYIYDSICRTSATLNSTVLVNPSPVVTISKSNDLDCSDLTAQLNATGGISYNWSPSNYIDNAQISNPVVNPPSDIKYTVIVTDTDKCTTEASVLVKSTIGNVGFYVPNAFTPNGDGLNDCFGLRYWGTPATFDMEIFDKWGMPVYHSKNINECWDGTYKGKKQGSGVYVYMISATSICGQSKVSRKGTIVLMR